MIIRAARPTEWKYLSRLCYASKAYWKYPESYMKAWTKELTISPAYLKDHQAYVLSDEGEIKALYTLADNKTARSSGTVTIEAGLWLDHFFIHPKWIGQGLGRILWQDVLQKCRALDVKKIRMFVDPHARGFYIKMGCSFVRMSPSSIPGREIPVFEYQINT